MGLSFGVYIGPNSGITGYSVGGCAGSIVGLNTSHSLNTDSKLSFGNTYSFGITLSNTPAYVSANVGNTLKFPLIITPGIMYLPNK